MGSESFETKLVWVDATNLVRWGLQVATGVQRVETGLLNLALLHDDVGVGIMDRRLGQIEPASARTKAYIRFLLNQQKEAIGCTYRERVKQELWFLDVQLKYGDMSTARRWATVLVGKWINNRTIFQAVKIICKAIFILAIVVRLIPALIVRLLQNDRLKTVPDTSTKPKFILSYELYSVRNWRAAIGKAKLEPVHIIYDLIPIHFKNLVNGRIATRIEKLFRDILVNNEISIAISRTVAQELSDWNDQAVLVPYARAFHACPLSSNVDLEGQGTPVLQLADKTFAMFVSTFDVRKCHYVLVEVWALLASKVPIETLPDLVFVGRSSHGLARVNAALHSAPEIASKIHVFHNMDDQQLLWCYKNTKLGLFPSITEGWGLGISEFLAHGVPVVHTDIPILHEAAQNLMPSAPAEDAMAWADVLEPLIADPAKLQNLRDIVAADYDRGTPDSFARCVFAYLHTLALRERQSAVSALKSPPNPHP